MVHLLCKKISSLIAFQVDFWYNFHDMLKAKIMPYLAFLFRKKDFFEL